MLPETEPASEYGDFDRLAIGSGRLAGSIGCADCARLVDDMTGVFEGGGSEVLSSAAGSTGFASSAGRARRTRASGAIARPSRLGDAGPPMRCWRALMGEAETGIGPLLIKEPSGTLLECSPKTRLACCFSAPGESCSAVNVRACRSTAASAQLYVVAPARAGTLTGSLPPGREGDRRMRLGEAGAVLLLALCV